MCSDSRIPCSRGYFEGVKGDLVFFDASDSFNGGLPFAIYDASNGKELFEDSAYFDGASSSSALKVVSTGAGYALEYLRVASANCDLRSEGTACWNRIKAELSLQSDDPPLCTGQLLSKLSCNARTRGLR